MFVNLTGLFSKRKKGRDHPVVTHGVVTLLVRFKGFNGDRFHDIPLPLITKSGFTTAPMIDRFLSIHEKEERYREAVLLDHKESIINLVSVRIGSSSMLIK